MLAIAANHSIFVIEQFIFCDNQNSDVWFGLLDHLKGVNEPSYSKNKDSERIKRMLDYIHSHYNEQMSLKDIAASAVIGTRECNRCFRRSIAFSPMEYLNYYRIQMAIQQLPVTDKSVTAINEDCGFSSIGYFGKVFKQYTGIPPLQYRTTLHSTFRRYHKED